jgi:type 1 glutamine amidotransferase
MRSIILVTLFVACFCTVAAAEAPKRVLLVGQGPDGHPPQTHEYVAGLKILRRCLQPVAGLETALVRADEPWKEGPELLERADCVVLFLCEGAKWMQQDAKRLDSLQKLAKRGGAIVGLHWGIGAKDEKYIDACVNLIGGCHGGADRKYQVLETNVQPEAKHAIATGIAAFRAKDEFYYKLKFAKTGQLQPVIQASIDGKDESVAWAWERPGGGRSFGFSGLHFHDNWKHPEYRRLVAQGVLWTLKLPIPKVGLAVDVPEEDLKIK